MASVVLCRAQLCISTQHRRNSGGTQDGATRSTHHSQRVNIVRKQRRKNTECPGPRRTYFSLAVTGLMPGAQVEHTGSVSRGLECTPVPAPAP